MLLPSIELCEAKGDLVQTWRGERRGEEEERRGERRRGEKGEEDEKRRRGEEGGEGNEWTWKKRGRSIGVGRTGREGEGQQ